MTAPYQGEQLQRDREPEHRIAWAVDDAGFVCSVVVVNHDTRTLTGWRKELADAANTSPVPFMETIRALRDRYPLATADIVMPDGWTLNDDGSATKDE